MFFDEPILERLKNGEESLYPELDAAGFPVMPGETEEGYLARILRLREEYAELRTELADGRNLDDAMGFRIGDGLPITGEILAEAAEETEKLFHFHIDWVPAFFLSKGLSFLWGGCTILTDTGLTLFFIRKEFRNSPRWFIYSRRELLAHELCHAARCCLHDLPAEEHFAYMTAKSPLRRWLGNCFQRDMDAVLFLAPVLLLLAVQILNCFQFVQLPALPFWILAAAYPAFLLFRNHRMRTAYRDAERHLTEAGFRFPRAVLFRCTTEEIQEFAWLRPGMIPEVLAQKTAAEFRWKIILARFGPDAPVLPREKPISDNE